MKLGKRCPLKRCSLQFTIIPVLNQQKPLPILQCLPGDIYQADHVSPVAQELSPKTSRTQKTKHYSPGAERWPSRFADVGLLAFAVRGSDWCFDNL